MLTLFLNLASHSSAPGEGACIACVTEKKTAAIRFIDHRIGDDLLMPELDAVLEEAGWEMEGIERVACVTGPGGFTSLRMAVTLANVLADQLQVPLAGVRLDEVYEGRVMSPVTSYQLRERSKLPSAKLRTGSTRNSKLETPSFLWLHSTKRTQLFVRGFGECAKQFPEARVMEVEELLSMLSASKSCFRNTTSPLRPLSSVLRPISWTGELLPAHEEAVAKAGGKKMELQPLAEMLPAFLASLTYEKKLLEPWYGRGW